MMISKNYITNGLPFLLPTDTGNRVLNIMEDNMVNELPVLEEQKYIGLLLNKDIYDMDLFDVKIEQAKSRILKVFTFENQHIFDAIKIMSLYGLSLLPVLNKKDEYLGVVTASTIVNNFAKMITINNEGYYLQMKIEKKDFSATEICNIIEKNNGKVLGMFIDSINENELMVVYLKIFTQEIENIIQSFDKFNYEIKILNNHENDVTEMYSERLDNLMNFLNL